MKKRVCLGYRAYPRSHGATMSEVVKAMPPQGLSPLARGNRAH